MVSFQKENKDFIFGDLSRDLASVKGMPFREWVKIYVEVTADSGTDTFTITTSWGMPFQVGQLVEFSSSGTLPTGISAATGYYIINATATTFQVSTTSGGGAVNFSSDGTGTISCYRYNGYITGDLISSGAYVIESILRDWVFMEKDLRITSITDGDELSIGGLMNTVDDDYYNGAYIYHPELNEADLIIDYDAGTQTITTRTTHTWFANDRVFITNIQGNNRIDMLSFDKVGNYWTGTRKDWYFAFSHSNKTSATELLEELAFELYCALIETAYKYRLVALDETTVTATWTNPLKQNGRELFSSTFLPLSSMYTDFTLNYAYNTGIAKTTKQFFVSPYAKSSAINDSYRELAEDTRNNYKFEQQFQYNSVHIQDDTTAQNLLQELVTMHTTQRHIIQWGGDVKNYIQYEVGDIIKINYASLMPDSLNNTARYMITGKQIKPLRLGNPYIVFTLVQIT